MLQVYEEQLRDLLGRAYEAGCHGCKEIKDTTVKEIEEEFLKENQVSAGWSSKDDHKDDQANPWVPQGIPQSRFDDYRTFLEETRSASPDNRYFTDAISWTTHDITA